VTIVGRLQRDETIDPDKTPLGEYLTTWIEGRAELAPLSVTQYRSVVKNHVTASPLGAMPLGKIRRAHIRAHELELQRKGLATSTRGVIGAVLSRALSDAVEDDLISVNPCSGRRRAREQQASAKFTVWTDAELCTLLDAVPAPGSRRSGGSL
jgi:hypothetical protein